MIGICEACQKKRRVWQSTRFGILICASCNRDVCILCGNPGQVAIRLKNEKAICNNCFQRERYKNIENHEICSKCGKTKAVNTRNEDDKAICLNCNRLKEVCIKCHKEKIIKVKKRMLCGGCDEKRRRNKATLRKTSLART